MVKSCRRTAVIFVTVIAVAFSGCAVTPDSLNKKGEKLLKNRDWDQALECFLQIIELDENDKRGYLGAAKAYDGMEKNNLAIEILEKGLRKAYDTDAITDALDELYYFKGEVWEKDYFSIKLKDGWKPDGDYCNAVYGGGKAELAVDYIAYEELGIDIPENPSQDDALKAVTAYFEKQTDANITKKPFILSGKNGVKFEYDDADTAYVTAANGYFYAIVFTVYDDIEDIGIGQSDLDAMARTFKIKPVSEEKISEAKKNSMNAIAKSISNEINGWLVKWDGKGYTVNRNEDARTYIIESDESGAFSAGIELDELFQNLLKSDKETIGKDLTDTLNDRFPNLKLTRVTAIIRDGGVDGILCCSANENADVYWDGENLRWVSDNAKADGVTADGIMFGTYPPHKK